MAIQKLVGPNQSSFVPGRQIVDNILAFQEVLNTASLKKGRVEAMILKIDLEKAYDRLSWSFIKDTLRDAGFSDIWIRHIMGCITSTRLAISLNGRQSQWFKPSRGIRQGDPISPLIFVLCIERLSHQINEKVGEGVWKGISISRNGPSIAHLLFADDMVLLGEATPQQALVIKQCLDIFCSASGQKVNFHKSSVFFSKNTQPTERSIITELLSIATTDNLGKYLGVPSQHGRLKKESFQGLIDRVKSRLAGWKMKTLSFAGRRVLAQSVLSAIPIYSMQSTMLPAGVIGSIEKLVRNFLWGGAAGERKCNLLAWEMVTRDLKDGGLGIRKLEDMNLAFMVKLGWRIQLGEDGLWTQIMKAKYGIQRLEPNTWQPKTAMTNAWKGILKAAPVLTKGLKKIVKNGRNTLFWLDPWIDHRPLADYISVNLPLPTLYARVSDYWDEATGWKWDELDHLLPSQVLSKLAAFILMDGEELEDTTGWGPESSGEFSISSTYSMITSQHSLQNSRKWSNIWSLKIPSRIQCFLWLVRHNRIMSNENRAKRRLTQNDKCDLCCDMIESTEHILRNCPAARQIWDILMPSLDNNIRRLPFLEWFDAGVDGWGVSRRKHNNRTTFAVALWWLWKWRNDRIFNGKQHGITQKIYWINMQVNEINEVFKKNERMGSSKPMRSWRLFKWSKPPPGWVKINIDGCYNPSTNQAGCGGLIRDEQGSWIKGFSYTVGACSIETAEAWALLKGIQLACALRLEKVCFESDALSIVNAVNQNETSSSITNNIIYACKRELRKIPTWVIQFVPREQNSAADQLAKTNGATTGIRILETPPVLLEQTLEEDRFGIPIWRQLDDLLL